MTRRYLALGDSYTIGEGVSANERWPMRLAVLIRALDTPLGDPDIVARTGWTTADLLRAIDTRSPSLGVDYDLVSLLIGVNDQYRGLGAEEFHKGFLTLLARAVSCARGEAARVIAISIPDWGVTPFAETDPRGAVAIGKEIDEFNALIRDEARKAGAQFADVTLASRAAAGNRKLLASDGLHPSPAMYDEWLPVIATETLRAFGRSTF